MDQRRRLKRLARRLFRHPERGEAAKFLIYKREQLPGSFGIALLNRAEDLGYIAHFSGSGGAGFLISDWVSPRTMSAMIQSCQSKRLIIPFAWFRRSGAGWLRRFLLSLDGDTLRGKDLPWHVSGPGFARFRLILSSLARDRRDADEHIAARALNLAAGELFITLQVPLTVGTRKLEFAHNRYSLGLQGYLELPAPLAAAGSGFDDGRVSLSLMSAR